MMRSGIKYSAGNIVILPFPFTDLSATKQRPVLIISNDSYNAAMEDVVVCGITSNFKDASYSVSLGQQELQEGVIPTLSRIKVDKIFTLKQSLIKKKVGAVKQEVLQEVIKEINKLFGN